MLPAPPPAQAVPGVAPQRACINILALARDDVARFLRTAITLAELGDGSQGVALRPSPSACTEESDALQHAFVLLEPGVAGSTQLQARRIVSCRTGEVRYAALAPASPCPTTSAAQKPFHMTSEHRRNMLRRLAPRHAGRAARRHA